MQRDEKILVYGFTFDQAKAVAVSKPPSDPMLSAGEDPNMIAAQPAAQPAVQLAPQPTVRIVVYSIILSGVEKGLGSR